MADTGDAAWNYCGETSIWKLSSAFNCMLCLFCTAPGRSLIFMIIVLCSMSFAMGSLLYTSCGLRQHAQKYGCDLRWENSGSEGLGDEIAKDAARSRANVWEVYCLRSPYSLWLRHFLWACEGTKSLVRHNWFTSSLRAKDRRSAAWPHQRGVVSPDIQFYFVRARWGKMFLKAWL